jgi:plasmid stabilization system protein ParE
MALVVRWTQEASTQLSEIIEHLEKNWSEMDIQNFFAKLEEGIEVVSTRPYQQKKSLRREGTREYQVSPLVTLFYAFDESAVVILLLWSNRMNPEDL